MQTALFFYPFNAVRPCSGAAVLFYDFNEACHDNISI